MMRTGNHTTLWKRIASCWRMKGIIARPVFYTFVVVSISSEITRGREGIKDSRSKERTHMAFTGYSMTDQTSNSASKFGRI